MALKDLTEDAVYTAIRECDELGRDAFLRKYGFHMSRGYFLDLGGKLYDSKAIAGVAHGFLAGQQRLRSQDFSGGRNTVKPVLEDLGFRVLSWEHFTPEQRARIYERSLPAAGDPNDEVGIPTDDKSWTDNELLACIEAYRLLWDAQLEGVALVKARLAEDALTGPLSGRTKSAYEFRMQNISAVLVDMNITWVKGYPPAKHIGSGMAVRLRSLIERVWQHEEAVAKAAVDVLNVVRGQGFMLSAAQKKAVELRAMDVAEAALIKAGYAVKDTSKNSSFDLLATKGAASLKVEVKGSTVSGISKIFMTRNEVELHRTERGKTALFVISEIALRQDGDAWSASGGVLRAYLGWDIEACTKQPLTFEVMLTGLSPGNAFSL